MEVPLELLSEPLTPNGAQGVYEMVEELYALQAYNAAVPRIPGTDSYRVPNSHWRVVQLHTGDPNPGNASLALITQWLAVGNETNVTRLAQARLHVCHSGDQYKVERLHSRAPVPFEAPFDSRQWTAHPGQLKDLVSLQLLWRRVQDEQVVFRGDGIDMTGFEAAMAAVPDVAEPTPRLRGKRFTRFLGQIAAQLGEVPWWVWPI